MSVSGSDADRTAPEPEGRGRPAVLQMSAEQEKAAATYRKRRGRRKLEAHNKKGSASKDFLTGLDNGVFNRALETESSTASHDDQGFLLIVDVDYFKKVNDTHGTLRLRPRDADAACRPCTGRAKMAPSCRTTSTRAGPAERPAFFEIALPGKQHIDCTASASIGPTSDVSGVEQPGRQCALREEQRTEPSPLGRWRPRAPGATTRQDARVEPSAKASPQVRSVFRRRAPTGDPRGSMCTMTYPRSPCEERIILIRQ